MRNARRLTMMGLVLCGVLVLTPNSWAQQRAPILDQVAKTFGIDSWDKVEAVRYTWNGEITGLFKAAHKWEWEPKTNKVTFEGVGKDGDFLIDFHQRFDFSDALRGCKLIEDLEPYLVEDPVRTEAFLEDIPKLRKLTTVPLAAGEEWGQGFQ